MDTTVLQELGLTYTEVKVYTALLELGASSAGVILEHSQLPNSTVHRDLNSLIEKGIINYILEGKRKIYQATDPEHFFELIEDKKRRFEKLLPELKKKQEHKKKEENATIYRGIKGIKEVYSIMRNAV